jgi:hypothetical protein
MGWDGMGWDGIERAGREGVSIEQRRNVGYSSTYSILLLQAFAKK